MNDPMEMAVVAAPVRKRVEEILRVLKQREDRSTTKSGDKT